MLKRLKRLKRLTKKGLLPSSHDTTQMGEEVATYALFLRRAWKFQCLYGLISFNKNGPNQWQFDHGELGSIYIQDTGPRNGEWEAHQAMDKAIMSTGMGLLRVPNDTITDQWLYDGAVTRRYVVRHVSTLPLRRGPFVVASCVVDEDDDRCGTRNKDRAHPTTWPSRISCRIHSS